MSRIFILRLALMLPTLGTVPLWAQRKDKRATVQAQTDTVKTTTQGIKQNVRSDAESLKSSIKTQTGAVTPDNTQGKAFKSSTQQQTKELLEDKTSNLEYNSEDPDNAPWKKQQLHVLDNPQAEFLKESAQMLKEGAISQCAVINRINFSEGIWWQGWGIWGIWCGLQDAWCGKRGNEKNRWNGDSRSSNEIILKRK